MRLETKCNQENRIISTSINKRKRTDEDDLISLETSAYPNTKKRCICSPAASPTEEMRKECDHSCVYMGMCANCGKKVDLDSSHKLPDGSPSKSFCLDWVQAGLSVTSPRTMKELFDKFTMNLLEDKKLRLVLDLDNTLVYCRKIIIPPCLMNQTESHSSKPKTTFDVDKDALYEQIDSDFGTDETEQDEESLSKYLQDVLSVVGSDKDPEIRTFSIGNRLYIVHFRPGLIEFLREMCNFYEINIYTHGTNVYALEILKCIVENKDIYIPHWLGRGEKRKRSEKKLSKMLCARKASIVVDDQPKVWCEKDRRNVWTVSPFKGEKSDCVLFDLAIALRNTHERYFAHLQQHHSFPDVRNFFDASKKF